MSPTGMALTDLNRKARKTWEQKPQFWEQHPHVTGVGPSDLKAAVGLICARPADLATVPMPRIPMITTGDASKAVRTLISHSFGQLALAVELSQAWHGLFKSYNYLFKSLRVGNALKDFRKSGLSVDAFPKSVGSLPTSVGPLTEAVASLPRYPQIASKL